MTYTAPPNEIHILPDYALLLSKVREKLAGRKRHKHAPEPVGYWIWWNEHVYIVNHNAAGSGAYEKL